jgi:hypothetical protein
VHEKDRRARTIPAHGKNILERLSLAAPQTQFFLDGDAKPTGLKR